MTDILIRDIPEDAARALTDLARAAGQDRMAYIRDLLVRQAGAPVIQERYAYRVYSSGGGHGKMTRYGNGHAACDGTTGTFLNFSQAEVTVMRRAEDLIRRNEVGDRERAVALLKETFEDVMEVPV